MIGIMTQSFDIKGDVVLENTEIDIGATSRRRNRTQTLDGSYVTEDRGFSEADRNLQITFNATNENIEKLRYLVTNYSQMLISFEQGTFRVSNDQLVESTLQNVVLYVNVEEKYA